MLGHQGTHKYPQAGPTERVMAEIDVEAVNILLVDDRPENLTALSAILDQPGYRLVTAMSGAEALWLVLAKSFAVVLLDVIMPVMDGIEVATLMKQRALSRDLPIIFLTADGIDLERVLQAYALGAVDYLARPVRPEIVRAKVSVFAELYRKTEEVKRQAKLLRDHDFREREREVAALKSAHERRYRDLAESDKRLVWRAAPDGSVWYFTRRWHEYTGLSDPASLGWAWLAAIHPEDADGFRARWLSSIQTGTRFQAECRIRRTDGVHGWHLCEAQPEKDSAGEVLGWLGSYTDVDAQKRADEERVELLGQVQSTRRYAEEMQRRLASLAEVSRLLGESLDIEASLQKIARHLVDTMFDGCIIELVEDDERTAPMVVAHRVPAAEARLRESLERNRALDTDADLAAAGADVAPVVLPAVVLPATDRARHVTPIERRGRMVGRMTLIAPVQSGWDPDQTGFADDIARRVALFVENVSLYEKSGHRTRKADPTHQVVRGPTP
jgi:PAS domain S-box-containing protein